MPEDHGDIIRRQLNKQQIELLQALYKFRFGTAKLIASYQKKSEQYTKVRLGILLDQGYVARNYDSSYRIERKPASYFLTPKAISLLKSNKELDKKGLHLLYYNRSAKENFVEHCLKLFDTYNKLDELFGDNLEFFSSSELSEQDHLPKPRPDAYLSFSGKHKSLPDCMLELFDASNPISRIKQRTIRYLNHYNDGIWDGEYPVIILVCTNQSLQKKLDNFTNYTLQYRHDSGLRYSTATIEDVKSTNYFKTISAKTKI